MNGPGVAFECEGKCGHARLGGQFHHWRSSIPPRGEPVRNGETGELVLTSINREAMPLLRYRTRDLTSLHPRAAAPADAPIAAFIASQGGRTTC